MFWVYFGTGANSTSRGIYRSEFDPQAATLSTPQLVAEVKNPTFLAIHPTQKFLYAVGEVNSTDGRKVGGVHAFKIESRTGELTKLNSSDSGGPGPCHVTCNPAGTCVIVANYAGGSVKCLKLLPDGSIGKESSFHQHVGSSVNPARQKEPHAHSTNVSSDGEFAIVADLGMDQLVIYRLDAKTAVLTPHGVYKTRPGSGPRHFAWHPSGKYAYTNGELDASVTALGFDPKLGTFTELNVCSTLPENVGDDVRAKNSTAEVVAHPDGRSVLVSNRGHNSIAHFRVIEDGRLAPAGHILGDIKTPRNFALDPTGRWIFVANQDDNSVVLFPWDDNQPGKAVGPKVQIGKPMCVRFVKKD